MSKPTPSTKKSPKHEPAIIGYAEKVDLPDWGIRRLKAKMDTGAASSSVHVTNLRELPGDRVSFDIVRREGREHLHVPVEADISRVTIVKPSSGKRQRRIFVKTRLTLGGVTRTVEVSLAKRATMRYRMLVGRAALKGFLVNPEHRYLLDKPARKTRPKRKTTPSAHRAAPAPPPTPDRDRTDP